VARDPVQPILTFAPRPRGARHGGGRTHQGHPRQERTRLCDVLDLGFVVGSGRIAALRVNQGSGSAIIDALFATPQPTGQVAVPLPRCTGWLAEDPSNAGIRWASSVRAALVVDCAGLPLGRVHTLVVDHQRQLVTDLLLDDGSRVPVDDAAFLGTDRVLVEADTHVVGDLALWLALQDDVVRGRLWWADGFEVPPALESHAAAGR